MNETEWKVQIEVPALVDLTDDSAWVTLRGHVFCNKEPAVQAYHDAKKKHEWPIRLIRCVQLGGPTTLNEQEELL